MNTVQTECNPEVLPVVHRNTPFLVEGGKIGTKQLYPPEPRPVVYIIPITSILGNLPLLPAGDQAPSLFKL